MKMILALLSILATLCIISPTYALVLNAGDSATFMYDFSSDSQTPPYNYYALDVYGEMLGTASFTGFDPLKKILEIW